MSSVGHGRSHNDLVTFSLHPRRTPLFLNLHEAKAILRQLSLGLCDHSRDLAKLAERLLDQVRQLYSEVRLGAVYEASVATSTLNCRPDPLLVAVHVLTQHVEQDLLAQSETANEVEDLETVYGIHFLIVEVRKETKRVLDWCGGLVARGWRGSLVLLAELLAVCDQIVLVEAKEVVETLRLQLGAVVHGEQLVEEAKLELKHVHLSPARPRNVYQLLHEEEAGGDVAPAEVENDFFEGLLLALAAEARLGKHLLLTLRGEKAAQVLLGKFDALVLFLVNGVG